MKENPERPATKNADRVLKLTETLRLTDEETGAYFSGVRVRTAPDGSIFVQNFVKQETHLYRFSAAGKFLGDVLKTGQGPGELEQLMRFLVEGDRLVLQSMIPAKILITDLGGTLIHEFRYQTRGYTTLVALAGADYIMTSSFTDTQSQRPDQMQRITNLILMDESGAVKRELPLYATTVYVSPPQGGVTFSSSKAPPPSTVMGNDLMFTCPDYGYPVQAIDLKKMTVGLRFTRKNHPRVKFFTKAPQVSSPFKTKMPTPDFFDDIQKLVVISGEIWAVTPLIVPGKGVLIDAFDLQGNYTDCFYLPLKGIKHPFDISGAIAGAEGDSLFIFEEDEEGVAAIVRYRVEKK